ncbi:MAG: M23 family metallopeptidase [Lachnospirales bacterium]
MPIRNYITSPYGYRNHPIKQEVLFHDGIDINGYESQPIYAISKGVVSDVYFSDTYGNVLEYEFEIENSKVKVFMAHLEKSLVEVGDIVEVGKEIAIVGSTGNSTGTHLHLSVYVDDVLINPLYILQYNYII